MINRRTVLRSTGATLGITAVDSPSQPPIGQKPGPQPHYIVVGSGPAGTVLAPRLCDDQRASACH